MPNPTKYQPSYSFSGYQASNPSRPLPGPQVDVQFSDIAESIGGLVDGLAQIRRSDGKLANASVDLAALSDEVIRELGGAGSGSNDGVIFATQAQAVAGTSTAVVMSPLRVREAIATFAGDGGSGAPVDIDDVSGLRGELDAQRANLLALDRELDGVPTAIGAARDAAVETVLAKRGAQNGLAPLDANGLLPANIFPEGSGGGEGGDLGYTPEDVARKNAANGYAGLDGNGRLLATQQGFRPDPVGAPTVFVPLAQRLGQEVRLTDGYVEGSNLTDFSDLFQTNMQRAIDTKRPFIVPGGEFRLTRKLVFTNASVFMFGFGKMQSILVWDGGEDSGLDFTSSDNARKPDHMHFSDFALMTKAKALGRALRCSWEPTLNTRFNPNDPTIFDRYSHRFLARDLNVRGYAYVTDDGWRRGIDVQYPIDAYFERCHVAGYQTASSDTGMQTESGLYAGVPNGVGHPTGVFFRQCYIQSVRTALEAEGCEGLVASECQLVGINNGIRFTDPLGRPLLMATNNHINAFVANIISSSASQIQIIGNSLYHTIGSSVDGTGVTIGGPSQHAIITGNVFESAIGSDKIFTGITVFKCDHGTIDHNTFRTGVVSPNASNMRGIVLGSDARFFKVGDNNRYENPLSGRPELRVTVNDGGVENVISGYGARYRRTADLSIAANTETTLPFTAIAEQTGNSGAANTNPWQAPTDGTYTIGFRAQFKQGATAGARVVSLRRGNATSGDIIGYASGDVTSSSTAMNLTATATVKLRKGEFIYPRVLSAYAATIGGTDGRTEFAWRRIGD